MQPFYTSPRGDAILYHGDALEVLSSLSLSGVALCMCDVPFNYQQEDAPEARGRKRAWRKEAYHALMMGIAQHTYNMLDNGGNLALINNPINLFATQYMYAQFVFRNAVPLIKSYAFHANGHLGFAHNILWLLCKGDKHACWYKMEERMSDVWNDITYQCGHRYGKDWHPQAIPLPIVERIIQLTTGPDDLIVDPFVGSGTTIVAAMKHGRRVIGIELKKEYCEMAVRRISRVAQQPTLSNMVNE